MLKFVPMFRALAPVNKSREVGTLINYWLLNYPVLSLFLFSYFIQLKEPFSLIYAIFVCLAQSIVLLTFTIFVLPFSLWLVSFKRLNFTKLAFYMVFVLFLILSLDRACFALIHAHFNFVLLQMILSPARFEIFHLHVDDYLWIALGIVCLLRLQIALLSWGRFDWKINYLKTIQLSAFLVLFSTQLMYVWADATNQPHLLIAAETSPWFKGATAKRFLAKYGFVDLEKRPSIKQVVRSLSYPQHPLQFQPATKPYNLIILAIDAWRADSLDSVITPNLFKFAQKNDNYLHHFSGGNSTRAGIFSLFYSLPPNLFDTFYQTKKGPLLIDTLKQQGYQLAAFTSASAVSPPFHHTVFVDFPNFTATSPGDDSIQRDRHVTQQVLKVLKNKSNPFFIFAFYDSAHAYNYPDNIPVPFQPSDKYNHFFLKNDTEKVLIHNQYRNALYFIDQEMKIIIDYLDQNKLLENTLVLITSDHGEEFDDNGSGIWGHNSNFTPAQTQVPFIAHWPAQKKPHVYQHITSHFDMVPTVMQGLLGITNPIADYSLGSILNDQQARDIILMASYHNMAIFCPEKQKLAVTNHFGYFQMQDKTPVDSALLALAYKKIHQFSR